MKTVKLSVLSSAIAMAVAGAGIAHVATVSATDLPLASSLESHAINNENPSGRYFITFVEPGLARNDGSTGYARTAPHFDGVTQNTTRKLRVDTSAARTYRAHLESQRALHIAEIESVIRRPLAIHFSFDVTSNAVSTELSAYEAARIAQIDGVVSVTPVGVAEPYTNRSATFIGADTIWNGASVPTYRPITSGQGIKVGIIDTGTFAGHPSFTNDPFCGFSESNPKLYPRDCTDTDVDGVCNGPNANATGNSHGVHVGSTAAGNFVDGSASPPPLLPVGSSMSGIAPCASVYSYRVADHNDGGLYGDYLMAAFENAMIDQVDVVNYSIGPTCGGGNPWSQPWFLDMMASDILVVAAAGNTRDACPDPVGRVSNNGPWVMTVAASTQDEIISPQLTVTGPGTVPAILQGIALNPGSTTLVPADTIDLTGSAIRTVANVEGCTASGGIPAATFSATDIAVLRRGTCGFAEKVTNAYNAGARTVIITNNQAGTISMNTTGAPTDVASFSISSQAIGDALLAFAANPPAEPTIVIFENGFEDGASEAVVAIGDYNRAASGFRQGDVLGGFSFRGPTPTPYENLTKPDITAPGIDIYAAVLAPEGNYDLNSGTSMASPQVAGAGALIRGVHSSWSPMEVKSALQTTASVIGYQEDGTTPWTVDQVGSGRVDLSRAALAGLTLDESIANLQAANPSGGTLDMRQLNLASLRDVGCNEVCTWQRTFRNRLNVQGTWELSAIDPPGYELSFSEDTITIASGHFKTVTITATATSPAPQTTLEFGQVVLSEINNRSPDQHLSVAVKAMPPTIAVAPAALQATQEPDVDDNTVTLNVSNVGGGTLNWSFTATGQGALWDQPVAGTSGIVSDYFTTPAAGAYTAADFVVSGSGSDISKIEAYGFAPAASPLAGRPEITWAIYGDASGVPDGDPDGPTGTPVWTFTTSPTAPGVSILGTGGTISLDLEAAGESLNLPAGTYWLSVYPTYETTAARWNWFQATQQGHPAKLISAQLFGGVPSWTNLSGLGLTFNDVAFKIEGTVACGASWFDVDTPSGALDGGDTDAVTVTFDSTGLADGTYSAYACIASNDPANPLVTIPVTLTVATTVPGCAVTQLFEDPGLEATNPADFTNPYWDSFSTNGGSAICDASCGGAGMRNGAFWAWLGGWGSGLETSTIAQEVTLPSGGADRYINFWLRRTVADTGDAHLQVNIDGNTIATFPKVTTSEAAYVLRSVQVPTEYLDGDDHTIELKFVNTTGNMGSMHVDDVTLECTDGARASSSTPPVVYDDLQRRSR